MKLWLKILSCALALGLALEAAAQQPILGVEITRIEPAFPGLPAPFDQVRGDFNPNETYFPFNRRDLGPSGWPLGTVAITSRAVGTFLQSSFTYSLFINGTEVARTSSPVPPGQEATFLWTPPQPGAYFFSVSATDGAITVNSLPVRFFSTGAVVNSPVDGTLVPQGSSIVLKADATVGEGFIKEVQFYRVANGVETAIGAPDRTLPYSLIFTPNDSPGGAPIQIIARATANDPSLNNSISPSEPITLRVVPPIEPRATSVISSPKHNTPIAIPTDPAVNIPISVDAFSASGRITKVELYIDGELFGTDTSFPYGFSWHPTVVGSYNLVALAYDDKNNVIASTTSTSTTSTPAPTTIIIAAPPTVTITSPLPGGTVTGGSPVSLTATASDSGGNPITSVQFFVDGTFVGGTTTASAGGIYTVSATLTQRVDDEGNPIPSAITALATNSLGLSGTSPAINVTVTQGGTGGGGGVTGQPPIVNVTSPANATTFRTGFGTTITAVASDPDGIISNVQFFANDTAVGAADTTPPYSAAWTPIAEGAYRLKAVATDNDGNATTSTLIHVQVTSSAAAVGAVYGGNYQRGVAESGRFALATYNGGKVAFIGRATLAGSAKYFYSDLPLGPTGAFSQSDGSISGTVADVFASGSLSGATAAMFSGPVALGASTVPAGYYPGGIGGGTFAAIVGADGSIAVYVKSGTFEDAGFGTTAASGAFHVAMPSGHQVTGAIDPNSGLLTGELIGGPGGQVTAVITRAKVAGTAYEHGSDIAHPNGNIYDQMLMTGAAATITADAGQVTRTSFIDLNDDIVQVEFSGRGALTISLDSASGPAPATKYNQPSVFYMKGHATITIVGADESSHVSIFTVGTQTAANQSLFPAGTTYDGVADVALLQISSPTGRFGGVRAANAGFFRTSGFTGLHAPGIQFGGPVYIHDVNAGGSATPTLMTGTIATGGEIRITGGNLTQDNGAAVQIGGATKIVMAAGTKSDGASLPAQPNAGVIERNGQNVTSSVIVPP